MVYFIFTDVSLKILNMDSVVDVGLLTIPIRQIWKELLKVNCFYLFLIIFKL